MNTWFLQFFFVAMFAEMFIAHTFPSWLAFLARIPLRDRRSIALTPSAARALSETPEPAGYREVVLSTIDLAKLGAPRMVKRGRIGVFFFLERGLIMAREGFGLVSRARPVVRVDIRAEKDRLIANAAFFPTSLLTMLLFFGGVVFASGTPVGVLLFGFLLVPLVVCAMSWRAATQGYDAAIAELEARLSAIDAARQGSASDRVRVEAERRGEDAAELAPSESASTDSASRTAALRPR
jgi:hypothetical protein